MTNPGFTSGPVPTVTRTQAGRYEIAFSGIGPGCPLPFFTPYGHNRAPGVLFGACGPDSVSYTIDLAGQDGAFLYLLVQAQPRTGAAAASSQETIVLEP